MGLFTSTKSAFNWKPLTSLSQWNTLFTSEENCLVFKHSTRCSISSMALNNFEKHWKENDFKNLYFLDLIAFREISNQIANDLNVQHQSPQAIIFNKNKIIYQASHSQIDAEEMQKLI
jgi:bacillithiol system protein YtxJ